MREGVGIVWASDERKNAPGAYVSVSAIPDAAMVGMHARQRLGGADVVLTVDETLRLISALSRAVHRVRNR